MRCLAFAWHEKSCTDSADGAVRLATHDEESLSEASTPSKLYSNNAAEYNSSDPQVLQDMFQRGSWRAVADKLPVHKVKTGGRGVECELNGSLKHRKGQMRKC